ncbi:MAG: SH3 domain-containing protein [Sarcina sp.]
MKKKIAALVLAASASMVMANANTEKVLADTFESSKPVTSNENVKVATAKSTQKAKVVNVSTSLRIRSSASTSASVVGNLKPGAVVNIQGKSGSWYKIESNGLVGYSHSDYLQIIDNSTGNNNGSVSYDKIGQVTNVTSSLRVRSSASTNSSVVGYLYPNEKINIKGESGSWYKVDYKGKVGYVHKDYLKVIGNGGTTTNPTNPTPPPVTPEVTPTEQKGQVINVSNSLNIRSSASTSSSVIGTLYPNEKFDIVGKSGSWYKINHKGKTGFVHSDYVKVITNDNSGTNPTPPPVTPDISVESGFGQVINVSSSLRVRSAANTSSSVVGYLYPGQTFKITGKSGVWYRIEFGGKTGFVHSDYVKKVDSDINSGTSQEKYNKVLSIMKAQVGAPYIWGGTGEDLTTETLETLKRRFPSNAAQGDYNIPSKYINSGYRAFDCSGLMQWSFRQVGVNLGRVTTQQINDGYEVSPKDAKPGDLLFFSSLSHVGMYIGNGQWIESPKPGQFVRITNVPWNLIGRARRVL